MLDLFGGRGGVRVMSVQGMSLDVIYPEWDANPLANLSENTYGLEHPSVPRIVLLRAYLVALCFLWCIHTSVVAISL
jgi:hypothetical protein